MKICNYYRGNFRKSSPGDLLQQRNKQSGLESSYVKPKEKNYIATSTKRHIFDPCKGIKVDGNGRVHAPGCGAVPGFSPISFFGLLPLM